MLGDADLVIPSGREDFALARLLVSNKGVRHFAVIGVRQVHRAVWIFIRGMVGSDGAGFIPRRRDLRLVVLLKHLQLNQRSVAQGDAAGLVFVLGGEPVNDALRRDANEVAVQAANSALNVRGVEVVRHRAARLPVHFDAAINRVLPGGRLLEVGFVQRIWAENAESDAVGVVRCHAEHDVFAVPCPRLGVQRVHLGHSLAPRRIAERAARLRVSLIAPPPEVVFDEPGRRRIQPVILRSWESVVRR